MTSDVEVSANPANQPADLKVSSTALPVGDLEKQSDSAKSKSSARIKDGSKKAVKGGKRKVTKRASASKARSTTSAGASGDGSLAKYPRHSVEKALRIPRAIIDQNAGRECSDREAAEFASVGFGGPFKVELSSAIKYGFLERPKPGHVRVTDRARQVVRPQHQGDEVEALRQAVMDAPDISAVYKHYRGENLPDGTFFSNALTGC